MSNITDFNATGALPQAVVTATLPVVAGKTSQEVNLGKLIESYPQSDLVNFNALVDAIIPAGPNGFQPMGISYILDFQSKDDTDYYDVRTAMRCREDLLIEEYKASKPYMHNWNVYNGTELIRTLDLRAESFGLSKFVNGKALAMVVNDKVNLSDPVTIDGKCKLDVNVQQRGTHLIAGHSGVAYLYIVRWILDPVKVVFGRARVIPMSYLVLDRDGNTAFSIDVGSEILQDLDFGREINERGDQNVAEAQKIDDYEEEYER